MKFTRTAYTSSPMNEPIRHNLCDACETAAWCAANGCIPVEEYDALTTPEETFRLIDLALSIAAVLILAAVVLGPLYFSWI